jgi:glycosyltransferase involved in cell wall biosynthesis
MNADKHPLVSVLTPVYNGESYLGECIESVLAQTYSNWSYIIVNNCSKDRTLEIASDYAMKDERIRVHNCETFLPIIANHNRAFRLIAPDSKYCKVVSADDWLYPECIGRMVELAEGHPTVGIIGSYQLRGGGGDWYLRNHGLSYFQRVVPGGEICRSQLLGTRDVFGNPTSTLYRADLVRSTDAFYPNETAEADLSACYKHLKFADFGFVHQVLSFERLHEDRVTTTSTELNAYLSSAISNCITYGLLYMTPKEIEMRVKELLGKYYRFLAVSALSFRNRAFWEYHGRRLNELGYPLSKAKLGRYICMKVLDLLLNPLRTVGSLARRWPRRSEAI